NSFSLGKPLILCKRFNSLLSSMMNFLGSSFPSLIALKNGHWSNRSIFNAPLGVSMIDSTPPYELMTFRDCVSVYLGMTKEFFFNTYEGVGINFTHRLHKHPILLLVFFSRAFQ